MAFPTVFQDYYSLDFSSIYVQAHKTIFSSVSNTLTSFPFSVLYQLQVVVGFFFVRFLFGGWGGCVFGLVHNTEYLFILKS